jgi:hypothetical protein
MAAGGNLRRQRRYPSSHAVRLSWGVRSSYAVQSEAVVVPCDEVVTNPLMLGPLEIWIGFDETTCIPLCLDEEVLVREQVCEAENPAVPVLLTPE